ncbi:hypothetical protein L1887_50553 [Cichorium endivia]|nr:hypothetical protein L1887_50553 [Cichorium endivia]
MGKRRVGTDLGPAGMVATCIAQLGLGIANVEQDGVLAPGVRELAHAHVVVRRHELGHRLEQPRLRVATRRALVVSRVEAGKLGEMLARAVLRDELEHLLERLVVLQLAGELGVTADEAVGALRLQTRCRELAERGRVGEVHKMDAAVPQQLLAELGGPVRLLLGRGLDEARRKQVRERAGQPAEERASKTAGGDDIVDGQSRCAERGRGQCHRNGGDGDARGFLSLERGGPRRRAHTSRVGWVSEWVCDLRPLLGWEAAALSQGAAAQHCSSARHSVEVEQPPKAPPNSSAPFPAFLACRSCQALTLSQLGHGQLHHRSALRRHITNDERHHEHKMR